MRIHFVDFDVEFHSSCRQDSPLCHELNIFFIVGSRSKSSVSTIMFCMLVLQNELYKKFKQRQMM